MTAPRAELALRAPALLGEGPCWHAARGTLWWLDITGRRFFEWDLRAAAPRVLPVPQLPGSIAPARDGRFVAALHEGLYLVAPADGALEPFATLPDHDPRQFRCNDGKVDPQGRFWAGTLSLTGRTGQSRLFRVGADRAVAVRREGVTISNGLAWSPDGRTLYYVDSPTRRVQAFAFDGADGTLHDARTAFALEADEGWPDGCCMDAAGGLWLGHWGAGSGGRPAAPHGPPARHPRDLLRLRRPETGPAVHHHRRPRRARRGPRTRGRLPLHARPRRPGSPHSCLRPLIPPFTP